MTDVVGWLAEVARGSAARLAAAGIALVGVLMLVRWARRAAARSIDDPSVRYHTRKLVGVLGALVAALIVGLASATLQLVPAPAMSRAA